MSTCRVPWCLLTHENSDEPIRGHRLEVGPFPGPGSASAADDERAPVELILIQQEIDGELEEPYVRIRYAVRGEPRGMEVSTALAADIGDLIQARAGRSQRQFASALIALHYLGGAAI